MAWWGGEIFLGIIETLRGGGGVPVITESPKGAVVTIPEPFIIFSPHKY